MKRYFKFNDSDSEEIFALIVGSKTAKAKFILHVPQETSGDTIYRVIKLLDRKFRHYRQKNLLRKHETACLSSFAVL